MATPINPALLQLGSLLSKTLLSPPTTDTIQLESRLTVKPGDDVKTIAIKLAESQSNLQLTFDSVDQQLSASQRQILQLIDATTCAAQELKTKTDALHQSYLSTEDNLIDRSQPQPVTQTLNKLLEWVNQLTHLKLWFSLLLVIQERSTDLMAKADNGAIEQVSEKLFDLIKLHRRFRSFDVHLQLNLFELFHRIIINTIHALVNLYSQKLILAFEEELHWPLPVVPPLVASPRLVEAFKLICDFQHQLESVGDLIITSDTEPKDCREKHQIWVPIPALLAINALIKPIELRFRYHFDSLKSTNRLDKPEWYFDHILQRLNEHEKFLSQDLQRLVDSNGYGRINAMTQFSCLLIEMAKKKLKQSIPQILELKTVLAHTIEKAIEFDESIRDRGFLPCQSESWSGTVEVVLGCHEWFEIWFEAERNFFEEVGMEIMNSSESWTIEEEDSRSIERGIKTTTSSLKLSDLIETIKFKAERLPKLEYRAKFHIDIQLELIKAYEMKAVGVLDAFESRLGILRSVESEPGLVKIVKVGLSCRWFEWVLENWNDDLFYLELYQDLKEQSSQLTCSSQKPLLQQLYQKLSAQTGGPENHFGPEISRFKRACERADGLLFKHLTRALLAELKAYIAKRWDFEEEEGTECELSPELLSPISFYQRTLRTIIPLIGPINGTKLYKSLVIELQETFMNKIVRSSSIRAISRAGGEQLLFDLKFGFLSCLSSEHHQELLIIKKAEKFWRKWYETCQLLSLPNRVVGNSKARPQSDEEKNCWTISKVIKCCFEDGKLGIDKVRIGLGFSPITGLSDKGLSLSDEEVLGVLRRRPECWR